VEPVPLRDYVITEHAAWEMQRRGISQEVIEKVMNSPEQVFEAKPGRIVLQTRLAIGDPRKVYLIRVFVDVDRRPPEVVTAYRTSRIAKYWRVEA
jgi:hypothetical protein